jgi:BTB/POZ domain
MSSLPNFDFSKLLDHESPESLGVKLHDVEFILFNNTGEVEGTMKAHKFVLSLVSEVFREQFYGTFPDKAKQENAITQIEIKDASPACFRYMIRYIYTGNSRKLATIKYLEVLLEVYRLADKYFISELKNLVQTYTTELPFSSKNYARTMKIISDYENLLCFEELCKDIRTRCATAVRSEWRTVNDSLKFLLADNKDDVAVKMALIQDIAKTVVCSKCKPVQQLIDCDDGAPLTPAMCKVNGLPVRAVANLGGNFKGVVAGTTGQVVVRNAPAGQQQSPLAVNWQNCYNNPMTIELQDDINKIVIHRH